ncbi:hypothetical protein HX870_10650 [Pseudomonas gingeri]|uniref:hypothetical protein n=1 Tax=Pseudomonas gingeri TaxID=117681 RepID=UPI0015A15527|nr:hypothetical protein [Pseudomonas gingeri]NWD68055.1 hypothetical protein [Pseudomonas gingeri]NWD73092.1 hypothetical protein [Pseudomonas gingeri]
MPLDQTDCSILGSLLLIACYLGRSLYYRQAAELTHAVILITASSSLVAAIALGSLTYFAHADELGILRNQKNSILVGALALSWVSVTTAYASLMHPRRLAKSPGPH